MRAGNPRVLACLGAAALGMMALAGLVAGCGHPSSERALALGQAPPPATPTMTPSAVPVLGPLTLGTFPSTWDGTRALNLCEDWAGLRAQYVARVGRDTPFRLEQWFSGAAWQPAFGANRPLLTDPAYGNIDAAFGQATIPDSASVARAGVLDRACAAAD
jgi:hypothetical protein